MDKKEFDPDKYDDIPLFDSITPDELKELLYCSGAFSRFYRKGEYILLNSEKADFVGIVLSGKVHMLSEDIWGQRSLLAYMTRGQLFGETFAMNSDRRSHMTFLAAEDTEALLMSADRMVHTCEKNCSYHRQMMRNLFELMSEKNMNLMEKIEVTGKGTVREKLMAYLSMLAKRQQSRYIHSELNRSDMADYLGVNRSAMTRELSRMRDEGILDYDRNTFRLLK